MASKPIKTDLFRFVTLRTPQLINEQRKDLGFIFHPDAAQSAFLSKIPSEATVEESRAAVRAEIKNLAAPFTSYLKVKAVEENVYKFSSWLMNNRNNFTKAEVVAEIGTLIPLTDAKLYELWDNLYYQVLTRKSSYVRQACIQMLMASNFITKYTSYSAEVHGDSEDDFLIRLANAKVVIDRSFTVAEDSTNSKVSNTSFVAKKAKEVAKNHMLSQDVKAYKNAIVELEKVDITYQQVYKADYDKKYAAYKLATDTIIKDAKKVQADLQKIEDELAASRSREPRIIPFDVNIDPFEFTFTSPFDKVYTSGVSAETKTIIDLESLAQKETINAAVLKLDKAVLTKTKSQLATVKTSKKSLVAAGVALDPIPRDLNQNCFTVHSVWNKRMSLNNLFFRINIGNNGEFIVSEKHKYTSGANILDSVSSITVAEENGIVNLQLFANENIVLSQSVFDLSGEFKLNNGRTLIYNITVQVNQGVAKGCVQVVEADDTTPVPTDEKPELYGVSKVGVADFRKVEQEVCCYVPGQVSHIENILAREYKERATRNLVSIESTKEDTTEKEVENLTDSSTTERNEMQSEVASVLTEDQSNAFGASAGVNGSYKMGTGNIGFNANAYADSANSSSSSLSNTNAQTYAQEVTDRTLERIVQKTSSKRTSRVLKEFEENNKHGFDNREGEQHVSGVYRWIDVIYKNQLVNYGKRLMYEFMVPEPSRFFKEAILKDVESAAGVESLVEPIHPFDLVMPVGIAGIKSAEDVNRSNYLFLASAYNAEVTAMQKNEITIGKSLSTSQQDLTGSVSKNETIKIPKGYQTRWCQMSHHGGFAPLGNVRLTAGINGLGSAGGVSSGIGFNPGVYDSEFPISVAATAYFSGANAITVICKLTDEAIQQWQNETFNAIMQAYNDRLQEYKDSKLAAGIGVNQEQEKIHFNPLFNRTLEKRELKRLCIEMIAKKFNNPMGHDNYDTSGSIKQNAEFENHAAHVKFFEQAFDWEIMAYLFYPYYWADKGDWKDLIQQTDAADPIFQAFLQSGMSRAVVPVRPGFEDAVVYYLETGDIWNGGDLVLDNEDDLYISIADEMQVIEGAVEDEWETRVPTSLTMIQKDTVGLNETGLPCCDFVLNNESGDDFTNPITPETALIGGPETTTTDPALIK